ncbi:hypothetical protein GW866_04515 [bacterium]|nr:hypothetical protein [bacterium]OIO87802.1 MAG: hypothetical protein AUK02_04615 [Anaerolineae bacterium CG2_30_58_95]PIZ25805.1 MAG: hypothetical protein COY47_03960 [Chloroflexi bacterium CG_4_10_14_0_8_um_filter_57_5]PJH75295.1 MAG: hypothetical protein CO064_07405 [Anaerolineae bacterium CG_4_9_14_0_8_um_filter_58_9]
MPHVTVPAIFDGKNVSLLEDSPVNEPYRVMVTFIKPEPNELMKTQMERFQASFGAWQDDRSVKKTINDIYETRTSRTKPPSI